MAAAERRDRRRHRARPATVRAASELPPITIGSAASADDVPSRPVRLAGDDGWRTAPVGCDGGTAVAVIGTASGSAAASGRRTRLTRSVTVSGDQPVAGIAGTFGSRHVAVPRDRAGGDGLAFGPSIGAPRDERRGGAGRGVDAVAVGERSQQAAERVQRGRCRRFDAVVPDQAAQLREALVAAGRVRNHRPRQAARPPFPDLAVAVDEEVVGNVRPSLAARVRGVEASDQPRHVSGVVRVRRGAVMHEQEPDVAVGFDAQWSGRCSSVSPIVPRMDGEPGQGLGRWCGRHRRAEHRHQRRGHAEGETGPQDRAAPKWPRMCRVVTHHGSPSDSIRWSTWLHTLAVASAQRSVAGCRNDASRLRNSSPTRPRPLGAFG